MTRRHSLLAFTAFLLTLVAGSSRHMVGDGVEYFAMAWSLAETGRPSVPANDAGALQHALVSAAPDFADADVSALGTAAHDGRRDFTHFWLYSALAAPLFGICDLVGVTPTWSFVALNGALLLVAFAVSASRLGPALTVLFFSGPIVWWTDKVHTEVFTFSTLTVAFVLLRDAPAWSMVALGAAAAQNPPIATFLPLTLAAVWVTDRARLKSVLFWMGTAAGTALVLLHPAYYQWRFGVPSLLVETTRRAWPSWTELGVVLWDPNLGLLASYPLFVVVTLGALLALARRAPRELLAADVVVSLAGGAVLLVGFTQTSNFMHGGTPGMSRYALWLVPLALPALTRAARTFTGGETRLLQAVAGASAIISLFAFHPRQVESAHRPTWIAEAMWTRVPWANNPPAEVFAESLGEPDRRRVPIATAGCEKALLVGRGDAQGMWPAPCYPADVPPVCRVPGRLCYANRSRNPGSQTGHGAGTGQAYTFVQAGDAASLGGFTFDPSGVWGLAAEEYLRMAMNGAGYRTLRPSPVSSPGSMVRAVHGVAHVRVLENGGRALVTMLSTTSDARVVVRPSGRTTGEFIDGRSGERLGAVSSPGASGVAWELPVPSPRDLVLLTLRPQP